MKPDIVYIYSHQASKWRGQELKYSLRSLERYGRNYGKVYIVGDKPPYLNDKIIHIKKEDKAANKERRIYEKLLCACQTEEISNPFLLFNDDYFLTRSIDLSLIGYFYFDRLENKVKSRKLNDIYRNALKNTAQALTERGLPTKHFDIHFPMKYYKDKFIEVMTGYDWEVRYGYVIKSLYANSLKIQGEDKPDHKIYLSHNKREIREVVKNSDIFSTDKITRALAEILQELYPNQSSYENILK